jgi:hypothetical protein
MRLFNQCVFDSYVSSTNATYSDPQFDAMLGSAEKLVLQVIADQVSGTSPTITVRLEHSADRRSWGNKNSGNAEINGSSLTSGSGSSQSVVGSDAGSTPGLGFSRLNIAMGGTTPGARLRVFATGRAENLY